MEIAMSDDATEEIIFAKASEQKILRELAQEHDRISNQLRPGFQIC